MALTRKLLKGMGLTDEQVETIIEAHTDTVNGLKDDIARYRADAEKLPGVQKELDDLKAKGDDGWKDKHDKLRKEYDDYKNEQTAKETRAAKEKAVRAYYESKNITGTSLDIAMKASGDEINGLELDDKGAIKDVTALDALVGGTLSGLVSTTKITGVNTPNPPANGGKTYTSKSEIMAIKDAGERQRAIAQNMDLFTKKG